MAEISQHDLLRQALTAHNEGRFEVVVEACEQILSTAPDHLNALQLLGAVYFRQARWSDAEARFRTALQLRPNLAQCWFNLAKAVAEQGRWAEAEKLDREGLARSPTDVRGLDHLGICLREQGRQVEATAVHRRCVELAPDDVAAWNHLGVCLALSGLPTAAVEAFSCALQRDGSAAQAWGNLGNALRETMRMEEAQVAFERAVAVNPDYALAWPGLLLNSQYLPDMSPSQRFEWHKRFAAHLRRGGACATPRPAARRPGSRLHIGYVSSELYEHAVAHFLLPLLKHHNREQLEVSVFANCTQADAMTAALRRHVDHWHVIYGVSDSDAADLVRRAGVDVLVDLNGHSGYSRFGVFVRQPAPVQVTYLGYPGTTGLSEIDYRITDDLADLPGCGDEFHTEKLWRLPAPAWCYEPHADSPEPSAPAMASNASIVFGCFNNPAKINATLIGWWCEILRKVPRSRLALKARQFADSAVRAQLHQRFASNGVAPERVELKPWKPDARQHMADYQDVDIALDTFPYHGTTTTCDALWMGVPVVVLAGNDHRSRVGVSLLTSLGLHELVAGSPAEYIAVAVALASNRDQLSALKRGLRPRMAASALLDGPGFAQKIENAYREMMHICHAES